jgi:hypothetical protein
MGVDAADPASPSTAPSRTKRVISKAAALVVEVGNHGAEPESSAHSPSRPKKAIALTDAPARETTPDDVVPGATSGAPLRQKRAVATLVAPREITANDIAPGASSNVPSRSKRAAPFPVTLDGDTGETGIDDLIPEVSSRPKRVITMKISPARALAIGSGETSPNTNLIAGIFSTEPNKEVEKKKAPWGGRRIKATKAADQDVAAKIESDNEGSDSEATRKEKKALAAKASKAMKNSQSMKGKHPVTFLY